MVCGVPFGCRTKLFFVHLPLVKMSDDLPKSKIEIEEEKKKKKEEAEANEKKIEYQIHTAVVQ